VDSSRILRVVARLKWTLTLRYLTRHTGNAVMMGLALLVFSGMALAGGILLLLACQAGGPQLRDPALFWTGWVLTVIWLSAPFMQFDAQRNLDLNSLRLLPVSRRSFTLAVMLDAALSPLGMFFALLTVIGTAAFSLTALDLLAVCVAFGLLWICWLALGQAIFLWANRLLMSRRFTDASIIVGVVIFVLAQSANLLFQSAEELSLPAWVPALLGGIWAVIKPLASMLFPGAAAAVVQNFAAGNYLAAVLNLGLLGGQAAICLWLAGIAVRQFYEGELESGGPAAQRVQQRRRRDGREPLVTGARGAMFHRERLYLWRDPTLKMVQLQSLFGALYFVIMALVFRINFGSGTQVGAQSDYAILFIALVLSFVESGLMFNKFGYEGGQLANLLVTPVDRAELLRAKSLYAMVHFGGVNLVLVTGLAVMLKAQLHFAIAAAIMVVTNTAVIDVIGHFISIYFPFGYVRRGRRVRAVMPQPGCGYMTLYMFVFQASNLVVLPASLALGLGVVFYGWGGLIAGTAVAVVMLYLAYGFGLPLAAKHLERREPELLASLTRSND
jgi:hypothetical protein